MYLTWVKILHVVSGELLFWLTLYICDIRDVSLQFNGKLLVNYKWLLRIIGRDGCTVHRDKALKCVTRSVCVRWTSSSDAHFPILQMSSMNGQKFCWLNAKCK